MNQKIFFAMVLFNLCVAGILYEVKGDAVFAILSFIVLNVLDAFALKYLFSKSSKSSNDNIKNKGEDHEGRH